jgi:hypothetical protein
MAIFNSYVKLPEGSFPIQTSIDFGDFPPSCRLCLGPVFTKRTGLRPWRDAKLAMQLREHWLMMVDGGYNIIIYIYLLLLLFIYYTYNYIYIYILLYYIILYYIMLYYITLCYIILFFFKKLYLYCIILYFFKDFIILYNII